MVGRREYPNVRSHAAALIGKAQSAESFSRISSQLNGLNTDINTRITADVQQNQFDRCVDFQTESTDRREHGPGRG